MSGQAKGPEAWRGGESLLARFERADALLDWMDLDDVFSYVQAERARAYAKHGEKSTEGAGVTDPTGKRLRVLTEELGEVAKLLNDADDEGWREDHLFSLFGELVQTMAMAGAWASAIMEEVRDRPEVLRRAADYGIMER